MSTEQSVCYLYSCTISAHENWLCKRQRSYSILFCRWNGLRLAATPTCPMCANDCEEHYLLFTIWRKNWINEAMRQRALAQIIPLGLSGCDMRTGTNRMCCRCHSVFCVCAWLLFTWCISCDRRLRKVQLLLASVSSGEFIECVRYLVTRTRDATYNRLASTAWTISTQID